MSRTLEESSNDMSKGDIIMKTSIRSLLVLPLLLVGINNALSFSFDFGDDDDDWWYYSYYGNQPMVSPYGTYFYPRLPYWQRNEMVDRRKAQMERKRSGMHELGDMLYTQEGFDRTRAIQIARAIEAGAGQTMSQDFHPGAVATYRSRTTLALWGNRQAFEGNSLALQAAAKALADELVKQPTVEQGAVMLRQRSDPYAEPSNKQVAVSPDVWQRYNEVSAICDHCHSSYRGPTRW